MIRIDSATITLSVWDDTNGVRREVTFPVSVLGAVIAGGAVICRNEYAIRHWWRDHEACIAEEQRIRLAAKDEPGPFIL